MNKKQSDYCYYRAKGHTKEQSYYKARYRPKSRLNAMKLASRLEQNDEIINAIESHKLKNAEEIGITEPLVLAGILNIAQNGKAESNRLKAWELLAKTQGLMIDKAQITQDIDITDKDKDILSRYFKGTVRQ